MSNRKAAFSAESYTLSGIPHVRCFTWARCVRLRAIRYDKDILNTIPYYDEVYNQIADVVSAAFSNKPVSWLDIGCGTGKMAKVAFEQCNVAKMICTDNSSAMLEAARQKISFSGVEFLKLPVEEINYDLQFDVITSILVNHYMTYEERMIAVSNCHHALKEGGVFITFENFAPCDDVMKNLYLKRWKKYQYSKGKSIKECEKHLSRYNTEYFPITIQEQIKILRDCGFMSVEIFWCSYMQVGILAI